MTIDALKSLLPIADWDDRRAEGVIFTGGIDPILPTPFKIGEAAAAALAATGLAVSDLWQLRTGRLQEVSVDARLATATLRGTKYIEIDEKSAAPNYNLLKSVFPTKDGRWVYLHCRFSHHRAAALSVLNVPEDVDAVHKAVATWDGLDLEEAIIAANGAGGMVRTMDEWAAHPQGVAVANLPLMEIVRIGDSPPEPLPEGDRPLSGIRVLDLTRVLAGPTCGRTLAEHGADVLKIAGAHLPNSDEEDFDTGRGKLSAYLDLREPQELETLRSLARNCDVFSQAYRPGALSKHGLSPEELAALRPGMVCVNMCAFSHEGPWTARRGFDSVVQSVSGLSDHQSKVLPGEKGGPIFLPASAIDYLTGYLMAFGAMVALKRRAQEGGSWLVRISLAQVGHWLAGLGQVPVAQLQDVPREFTEAEIESWMMTTPISVGSFRHLKSVVGLSETPPYCVRPPVPLGTHKPEWPVV